MPSSALREYALGVVQPTLPFAAPEGAVARYDEVIAPDGTLRAGWSPFADRASALDADELYRVESEIAALLADAGVTYAPTGSTPQPWRLDPLPLVLDAEAWAALERGLVQRAELLNAVLEDVYGAQHLLVEGIVPPAAILAHPGFLRALARPGAAPARPLVIGATDLGRDAHGVWHVVADRVQAPSGLGYALQNRRVLSQVLPDLFPDGLLHRAEPYVAALRATLLESAPGPTDDPRVVVLSPGVHSETAYDQAALARALGFPLVQGGDLVVREGRVWMKPVGWPDAAPREPVDVILRRVDAEWCDPLELRGDSHLGVAGLTEVVRRGGVRVVNGLGAGVLENPALLPFLPAVCERLLGEPLRLPSVPTWWCGDPEGLETVLARLDDGIVVREIGGRRLPADASADDVRARILAAPYRFAGQERLPLSQAPVWARGSQPEPQPLVLRAFTVHHRSAYRVFAGGLATMVEEGAGARATKDVWVLKAGAGDRDQGLDVEPVALASTVPPPAARTLEDMFWAGRYAERAEDLLRLVLAAPTDADPGAEDTDDADAAPRASADAASAAIAAALRALAGRRFPDPERELRSLLLDAERVGSAAHSIARLRGAMEDVRDQLSGDTWRTFAAADRAALSLRATRLPHPVAESAGRMLMAVLALQAVTASMMRDSGWRMIEIGRHLERGLQLCTMLRATAVVRRRPADERDVLEAVLTASESAVTHRRRARGGVRVPGVLELLLRDADNPRSLRFCLDRLAEHLAALPGATGATAPERMLRDLIDRAAATDPDALAVDDDGRRGALADELDETAEQLRGLADAIARVHFAVGPPSRSLADLPLTPVAEGAS